MNHCGLEIRMQKSKYLVVGLPAITETPKIDEPGIQGSEVVKLIGCNLNEKRIRYILNNKSGTTKWYTKILDITYTKNLPEHRLRNYL